MMGYQPISAIGLIYVVPSLILLSGSRYSPVAETVAEPDTFPIWLGFPSIACLFPVLSHDRALRNTALSVERVKFLGRF